MARRRKRDDPPAAAPPSRSALRENFESIVVAGLFAMFVRGFVAQPYKIPSGSMEDSLLIGDHLAVNKVMYGSGTDRDGPAFVPTRPVRRGDVVIFRPPHQPDVDYIKRVVGLPGETLRLSYSPQRRGVRIFADGEPVPENYVIKPAEAMGHPGERGPERLVKEDGARWTVYHAGEPAELRHGWPERTFKLGEDQYFVMGDNRNDSADSRFWGEHHAVDGERIRGRAWLVYWSYEGEDAEPEGLGQRVRFYARIAWNFFGNSRWNRSFQLIR